MMDLSFTHLALLTRMSIWLSFPSKDSVDGGKVHSSATALDSILVSGPPPIRSLIIILLSDISCSLSGHEVCVSVLWSM